MSSEDSDASLASRRTTIQRKTRFIGNKFAVLTGQKAPSVPAQNLLTNLGGVLGGQSSPGFTASPGAFANAGFKERAGLPTGYVPAAATEGDFNEDGHTDVAICNAGDNTIYVYLGNGDGTFRVPEILYTRGQSPNWIAAVKLRANGHLDLAVTDGDSDGVEVFTGNGDGTFQPGAQVTLLQIPTFVVAGDFNNDGNADLAIGLVVDAGRDEPQFEVLLGDGAGGFSNTLFPPPISAFDSPVPTGWIAIGDVNNDGYTDLVTTITGDEAITYLNQAGATFVQGAPFGPIDVAMVVELGDMNEDGCLDAVELGTYGYISIAAGTCDGNFTQGDFLAELGDLEPAVRLADVNGDGHLDVVGSAAYYDVGGIGYGAEGGYLVSVLKGDGKGNVTPAQVFRGGRDAYSLIVADFNGDQRPEILTVDSFENRSTLFFNDGNGNFGDPQGEVIGYLHGIINSPLPGSPTQAVDFNGDGKPDLLLVEFGTGSSQPSQFTTMLNDGTGKFLPPVRTPISIGSTIPYPQFVAGAFRNGGKVDLIYVSLYQPPEIVAFFPGNGDGTFGSPATLATLPYPTELIAGDFNHDGKLDFVVYGTDGGTNLELDVFLGNGDGTFNHLTPQIFADPSTGMPQQIFTLDLNHDGKLDLLVGNNLNGGLTDAGDDLVQMLGNGDGTFQPAKILIPHFGPVAIADVNGDGLPDLIQNRDPAAVAPSGFLPAGVAVYLAAADGTFRQQPSYHLPGLVIPSFAPALVGDFNGDGIPDIGIRYLQTTTGAPSEARMRVLQGAGDGTFIVTNHTTLLPAYSNPFLGADFNGDGATDLVELNGYTASFHTLPAAEAPSLDIAFNSAPILGTSGNATVTLDKPAVTALTVALSASDAAVQVPAALQFAAGEQALSFPFTLGPNFDPTHVLALSATLNQETATAYAAKPNPNTSPGVLAGLYGPTISFSFQTAVTPGETFSAGLSLISTNGYYGTFSSPQCLNLPAGVSCNFATQSTLVNGASVGIFPFTVTTSASTPFGTFPVQVVSTDGQVQAVATLQLGIGDFSIQINPTTLVMGPSGTALTALNSTSTNGLNEEMQVTCSGLPADLPCGPESFVFAQSSSVGVAVTGSSIAARDYPFQITGTIHLLSHSIPAVLRVGDFSAALDKSSATLSHGQSATFTVTLTSINHYTSNITVFCEASSTISCAASPSPAALTDGGTVSVQLTVTAAATTAAVVPRPEFMNFPGAVCFATTVILLVLMPRRSQRTWASWTALIVLLLLIGACGGGSSSIQLPPPPPPPPPQGPQTISIPVVASAETTYSDSFNQKTIGPIVITLQ